MLLCNSTASHQCQCVCFCRSPLFYSFVRFLSIQFFTRACVLQKYSIQQKSFRMVWVRCVGGSLLHLFRMRFHFIMIFFSAALKLCCFYDINVNSASFALLCSAIFFVWIRRPVHKQQYTQHHCAKIILFSSIEDKLMEVL